MPTKQKLLLIDGNALIHRSFHALPPTMKTKSGEIINAVFGFTSFLLKSIKEFKPAYVILTLDKADPTFRHEKFEDYKGHREKAADELYEQFPRVKDVARALAIPIFEKSGFEADDLIGTIAKKVEIQELPIENIIVTGDMDTLQLVSKDTKVFTMSRGIADSKLYGAKEVKDRYDLDVAQMIDYKALRGDPSDNIPGVKGVGEKTATNLLHDFKTLDKLYEHVEKNSKKIQEAVKPRIIGLLQEHKDDAYLSQDLATIKCDVDMELDLDKAKFGDYKKEELVELFGELEFNSLLTRLNDLEGRAETKEEKQEKSDNKFERNINDFKYKLIDNDKDFDKFLKELSKQKEFTFDTETSGFDPLASDLLGISFSWKEGEAFYLKINPESSGEELKINNDDEVNLFNYGNTNDNSKSVEELNPWLNKLRPIFEDEKVKKSAHNMKFDVRVMGANGIKVSGIDFDTMIASYLLNPGSRQHNLDALTFAELGFEKISKDDLLGTGRDKISFSEVETEKLSLYSCEDADFTHRLLKKLSKKLKDNKLTKLFAEMEMPLVEVLCGMEDNGVLVDKKFLSKMSEKMTKEINALEKKIHKLAGSDFNIKSTKQLKEVLFEKLEISTQGIKRTKTGFSTAFDELEKIKHEHEIVALIQEYRELTKLTSTYVNALPELINNKTGRVHTSYNQTVTATGRLSSSNPNLQNIPVRTELGREIRKAFIAEKGYKLVALDYSQIELRLAAHISGDKKMIQAFKDSADIHASTAAEINNVPLDKVEKSMRREAKAINFGILYGQGPHGLSKTADIPYARAKEFIDKYFEVYKDIKKYTIDMVAKAKVDGYVETLFNRKRYLPEINSSVAMIKKSAERMAVNTPLQGTSADMIKIAMIKVAEMIKEKKQDDIRMLMQVHDELIFEIKEEKVKKYSDSIKKIMEEIIQLKVPVIVDANVGDSWGTLS